MRRIARLGPLIGLLASAIVAGSASAHPLGNYTVNRAVVVSVAPGELTVDYVVDMAEIPAFATMQDIDLDADGAIAAAEGEAWSVGSCTALAASLEVVVSGQRQILHAATRPQLTFPPGAGGLETLRLVCAFRAPVAAASGRQTLAIEDHAEDGHVGWHELTIVAADGVLLLASDVPMVSASAALTAYPADALQSPPDVRSGRATFAVDPGAIGSVPKAGSPASATDRTDPLAALFTPSSSPTTWLVALALAALLGVAHAISPGHGKALVAAYLVGSGGSMRRAASLGLTVAVTHTAGVFVLGAIILSAGELLAPERVVAWLSLGSGVLVIALGAAVAVRAVHCRSNGEAPLPHHGHAHAHGHPHRHPHLQPQPPIREMLTLGLAGGLVPSASALIVLLVAVTTGRLLDGLLLILAFGVGMAVVLAGIAAAATVARDRLAGAPGLMAYPSLRRIAAALPLASATVIMAAGALATIGALGSL